MEGIVKRFSLGTPVLPATLTPGDEKQGPRTAVFGKATGKSRKCSHGSYQHSVPLTGAGTERNFYRIGNLRDPLHLEILKQPSPFV